MFRLSARLISIGSRRYKQVDCVTYLPALRFAQSLLQMSTVQNVSRSIENSTPQIVYLLNSVQDFGFNEDDLKTLIKKQPDLSNKSSSRWKDVLGSLTDAGFKKDDIVSILVKWPDVFSLKKNELDTNLMAWFGCKFGEELTNIILTTHPSFLKVNHLVVSKRVKQYQIHFQSKKRAGKLLLLAPNTLEERWPELMDKLNYLDELCTDKSDIVSTGVLAYNSLHIKARHEFLIRAGIYKRPAKEFNKKLSKNPKLTDIVNLSDEVFAVKLAGLSLLEYETFLEMFEKECKESENLIFDSDDEEDYKLSYSKHKSSRR